MDAFLSVILQSRSSGKSLREHILNRVFRYVLREINKYYIHKFTDTTVNFQATAQLTYVTVLSYTTHEFPYQNSKQLRNILYTESGYTTTMKTQFTLSTKRLNQTANTKIVFCECRSYGYFYLSL